MPFDICRCRPFAAALLPPAGLLRPQLARNAFWSPRLLPNRPLTAHPTPSRPTPPLSTTALVLRPRRPVSPALPAATIFPGARGAFQPWGGVSSEVDKIRKGHVRWHPRAPFTSPLSKKRPWVCLVLLCRLPSRAIACPWSSPRS